MIFAWVLMLMELAVDLLHPLFMVKIIDEGIVKGDLSIVYRWGALMLLTSIIAFAAGITNSFAASHVGQNFGYDVRKALFKKIQTFSFADFNRFSSSTLITRLTNDVTQIQMTIFLFLRIALKAPLLVIFGTLMVFLINFRLALVLGVTIPLSIAFLVWMYKKSSHLFQIVQSKLDRVNGILSENLAGIRLIKAFLRSHFEGSRFKKASHALMKKTIEVSTIVELVSPILHFVMNSSILVILWFANKEILSNQAEIGEVVAIVNYAMRITMSLSMATFILMFVSRAHASTERIQDVLETSVQMEEDKEVAPFQIQDGHICFKNVSFRYPGDSVTVLDDLSFTVEPNETIAILGATGAGKSSLFQLIPRLYDVSEGAVHIDGIDVREMKQEHLRNQIGLVPQDALLFSGTIKENIQWGKEDATMDEIINAAKHAQIHETIMKFPHSYRTVIGQKGVNLSGGQKQRISLARAFIRQPKILLLDDSTSALDMKTEEKLLEGLRSYKGTKLLITQKISTALKADRIFILEDGKIVAMGTHGKLLRISDLYRKIVQSQNMRKGAFQYVKTSSANEN